MRECAAEQRTSSWIRARVAKGLPTAPLRQFRRANSRKGGEFQDQGLPSYVVPEFRVLAAQIWPTHRDLLGSENRKRSLSVREIRRIFGAGDVVYGSQLLRKHHPGRETQTPVPTKLGSVDLHVETQVCADPLLLTQALSSKSSKLAGSVT